MAHAPPGKPLCAPWQRGQWGAQAPTPCPPRGQPGPPRPHPSGSRELMGRHCRSWGGTPVLEPCWSCWRHHGDMGPWVITASQSAHPAGPFRQAEVTTAGRRFHRRGSADTCWRNIAKSLGCSRKRRGDLLPVRRPSASCLSPALLEEGWLGGGGGKESQGAPRTPWVSNVGGGCAGTPTARPGKPGLPGDSHVPPPSPTRQMSPGPWSSTSLLPCLGSLGAL